MLTLQFIPYNDINSLTPERRIKKLINVVKEEKTMEHIKRSNFKGIEICTIYPETDRNLIDKLKSKIANFLLGNREGLTIIGPATVVKEIKKDPDKIQLLTADIKKKPKRR